MVTRLKPIDKSAQGGGAPRGYENLRSAPCFIVQRVRPAATQALR